MSHEGSDKPLNYFQLNLCKSSTVALTFATSLIMIPATLTNLSGIVEGLTEMLSPGSFIYYLSLFIFISLFSYLFAWLFFHPKRRLEKMKLRGWAFESIEVPNEKYLLNKIFIYTLPWTAFLFVLAIVPNILIMGFNIPFYIGGASAPLVAAIGLDLWNRYKFYKTTSQKPIKIAEFHDIYDATMIQNHLNDIGISCHLQGFYHRHLLYFFGPHVEISLMVSIADKKTAQELITKNYGGLGL